MNGGRARRWGARQTAVAVGVGMVALTATALPAFGHASFPGYSANGFLPNTQGGTGVDATVTPPYPANTEVTMYLRAAGERQDPFNNAPDSNVDLKVTVPAGWTNPTCGQALLQVKDASTNNTNQPGAAVPGWNCEVYTSAGHAIVHFWGPQVGANQTLADSAQFFMFKATTPSPLVQTSYDGTNGTEGFIADQQYASGPISHWIPNAAYPGITPPGADTEVATGLVRTVAAFDPNSTTTTTSTTTTSTTSTTTPTSSTTSTVPTSNVAAAAVTVTPAYAG